MFAKGSILAATKAIFSTFIRDTYEIPTESDVTFGQLRLQPITYVAQDSVTSFVEIDRWREREKVANIFDGCQNKLSPSI